MAARHSKDAHKLLQQRMQKLQEGLPPQGQQYSYKAAAAVSKHLAIVDACLEASLHILQQPIPKPEHLSLIGQLLGVLNQYLAWSLLGLDRSRCAAVGHGTTQAPHGSSSGDASSSSNTTGHPGQPCACCASGSCHAAGQEDLLHTEDVHVYTCLQHTYKLLLAVRGARKSGVEQAIAPELLAPGTGELLSKPCSLPHSWPMVCRQQLGQHLRVCFVQQASSQLTQEKIMYVCDMGLIAVHCQLIAVLALLACTGHLCIIVCGAAR
jgi:hypothetical protein